MLYYWKGKSGGLETEWCFANSQTAVELTDQPTSPGSQFIASAELYEILYCSVHSSIMWAAKRLLKGL